MPGVAWGPSTVALDLGGRSKRFGRPLITRTLQSPCPRCTPRHLPRPRRAPNVRWTLTCRYVGRTRKGYERCLTWIKPSFLWMMYRCGWGAKEGQETVLAVEISREGFEWALEHACLSHYEHGLHADRATWKRQLKWAPARVQWDPERDLHLQPLAHRSLQLGLVGEAARLYADEWTVSITDITSLAHTVHAHVQDGGLDAARQLLPRERPYPVNEGDLAHLHR
ncbi:DUF4291 domain-containing protein [Streptomyces sp. JH14]|uniref:DUF4291 domain-containing protein n=1 Tax=Streptomyces sp. JH14 TaxID=2793630 RepID=UPI0023F7DC4C|nr:DUF4291 domain-containing protein [Streptomyces sp. JH14]MDF6040981.1 DUF4291 domain-containing protein [Streptomyces sp. JH14]